MARPRTTVSTIQLSLRTPPAASLRVRAIPRPEATARFPLQGRRSSEFQPYVHAGPRGLRPYARLIGYFDRPCACGLRLIMLLIARRPRLTTAMRIRDRVGDDLVLRRVALALLLLLDHYCVG